MTAHIDPDSSGWLVFGLSGQVGDALRTQLREGDPPVLALSRQARAATGSVAWRQGSLADFRLPATAVAAIASLGPLDAFVDWFECAPLAPPVLVVLGSTSVHGKRGSPDPLEVALAHRLAASERRLQALAASRGSRLTLLRPTLVYGNGRDRSLSRAVALARRWGWLPMPRAAAGLRQPVHVDDVAAAVLRCLRDPALGGGLWDLPGGETLTFAEMIRRTLAVAAPAARLLTVPDPLFRTAVRLGRRAGRLDGAGEGLLARLGQDLAYDLEPVRSALGIRPRPFAPTAEMFSRCDRGRASGR